MPSPKYRNDIQGLRAVAALLVAIYHIWFHRVSGAVDLFFFISAYFMTASLMRRLAGETAGDQWSQVRRFWTNLLKRMLPQAWTVLVVTALLTWIIMPITWWRQIISEVIAAATFVVNWVLAAHGNDYLHAGDVPSPLQHYWAMAVQLQVYLIWPMIIWGTIRVARRLGVSSRRSVFIALCGLGLISLGYSVFLTSVNQPLAYYDTFTRFWEFAAGGIFAIVLPYLRIPRILRLLSGWVGLVGLLCFGMLVNVSASFPGFIAAVPLAFAALIFISTETGSKFSTEYLLSRRPVTWLGANSYGLYLWHWPILTLWLARNGQDQLSFAQGVVAIELAIALAWLTTKFVEAPLRRAAPSTAPRRRSLQPTRRTIVVPSKALQGIGAIGLCLVLVMTLWATHIRQLTKVANGSDNPGAAVLQPGYDGPQLFDTLQPSLASLSSQWPEWSPTCETHAAYGQEISECTYDGRPADAADAHPTVFVTGSSHVDTWMTALAPLAQRHQWRIKSIVGPGCDMHAYSDDQAELTADTTDTCAAQNQIALDRIREERPDAIFTTGNRSVPGSPELTVDSRFISRVEQLRQLDIPIIVLRDNPRFAADPNTCIAEQRDYQVGVEKCSVNRDDVLAPAAYDEAFPEPLFSDPSVVTMDLSDQFCTDTRCPPAIGGVLIYLDKSHPTKTYVRTMIPAFDQAFTSALTQAMRDEGQYPIV
ncbi:acyltransferase family protein [Pseudoclavibacter sp. 13-3]|uniref:acyltransferase family protein n=1 Tax=Pseudoclavibacter sp. 13-3 TaxID=2901228 RepID=UPI001E33D933|nr:acyltransferase family protein [Pseudoclavibacter sp. 13-3]MCD7101219.1 acyltransferase [Pseudoclavibacter sp. 13-3]